MDERDLLPASIRSGANFNVYPQYSRIEDRVAWLKEFCTASTKRLLTQCFPAGMYLLKVNNRNTRTRCVICSKLTIKTPERRH